MGSELELIAREIDPMAWKAWEITPEIETRKRVSIEKARTALQRLRTIGGAALDRGAAAISQGVGAGPDELAQRASTAIIDEITVR